VGKHCRLALKAHPDRCGSTSDATEKFQAIQTGYETLFDESSQFKVLDSVEGTVTEETAKIYALLDFRRGKSKGKGPAKQYNDRQPELLRDPGVFLLRPIRWLRRMD